MNFKTMTLEDLMILAKECFASIEEDCFSTTDIMKLDLAEEELKSRGYKLEVHRILTIKKIKA